MIRFDYVRKELGKKTLFDDTRKVVLDGIDFHLKRGEIMGLLGPSGSGKTTIVKLIAGTLVPTYGTVTVMGEHAPYKNIRKHIGYMPQENALYDDLTGIENLNFFGKMHGLKGNLLKQQAEEMLRMADLYRDADRMVCDYSEGMKRRLSLCIAMMHNPDILILDEPTASLDPSHRKRIWEEFARLAENGKTILVTTHLMDEAMRCDSIVMLYKGRVAATGSPAQILELSETTSLDDAFLKLEGGSRHD